MPQDITTTVYTLAELKAAGNTKGFERAMQWMRLTQAELWEGGDIIETWKPALEAIGFHEPEIHFTGFASQGDGAGFTCKHIAIDDILKFMAGEAPGEYDWPDIREARPAYNPRWRRLVAAQPWLSMSIERTGHYCHAQSYSIGWALYVNRDHPRIDAMLPDFIKALEELRVSLCNAIYTDLQGDYDGQLEDESLEDSAEANEYTFTDDGERFG